MNSVFRKLPIAAETETIRINHRFLAERPSERTSHLVVETRSAVSLSVVETRKQGVLRHKLVKQITAEHKIESLSEIIQANCIQHYD